MSITTRGLRRWFGDGGRRTIALDGIDLDVAPGHVHGVLGPNGAGKTTTVKVLTTLLVPSAGVAQVDGLDVVADTRQVRRRIGLVLGGERGLHDRLTARENLRYAGVLHEMTYADAARQADPLLERVGLAEHADDPVEGFSRGMKQRVHLARGLVGDPRVVFLDEPTTGLDPVAALAFRDLVRELAAEGRTVLLTTHDMAEAEAVCDRVSLLRDGRVLATETPTSLGRLVSQYERVDATVSDVAAARTALARLVGDERVTDLGEGRLRVETDAETTRDVLRALVELEVEAITTSRPTLQEVYLHHFGQRGMRM
jgi:ABC-2 type transport system ATP-binding protein